jgi:acetyltransferase
VGGVKLNLNNEGEVTRAFLAIKESISAADFLGVTVQPMLKLDGYELIIGSSADPQFGPVLLFGTGGQLVEVLKDRCLGLPPLNTTLARRMMEQTKIYQALKGVRGRQSLNLAALEQLMVLFSQLVLEQPGIKEIEINPLLASSEGLIALDARVVLYHRDCKEEELPSSAIRPYPLQYVSCGKLKDGKEIVIRPIRPEDEPLVLNFCEALSEQSVYFRYFHLINIKSLVSHERLARICFIDYDREMALVADYENPDTKEHQILAIARLSKLHGSPQETELGLLVSDRLQRQGLGTMLGERLLEIGRQERLKVIIADILPENKPMQNLCQKLGFNLERNIDVVRAVYQISPD